jgi:MtN3 and saliva related transmembrane protein
VEADVEPNLDWLGYVAATLTTLAFVPQAVKSIRSRETGAISFWMYTTFTVGVALWLAYGVGLHAWPIIFSNTIVFPLAAVILAFKVRHG